MRFLVCIALGILVITLFSTSCASKPEMVYDSANYDTVMVFDRERSSYCYRVVRTTK